MKRLFVPLLLLALAGVGCNNKKDDDSAPVGAARTRGMETTGAVANLPTGDLFSMGIVPGQVGVENTKQAEFNTALKHFVSSNMNPQNLGTVNTKGAVVVQGQVNVGSGNQVTTDSWFEIIISDSFVGKADAQGEIYEPVRVHIPFREGYVSGNTAKLVFADDYGSVTMDGTFDNNFFKGSLSFVNTKIYDGAPAAETPHNGTIGGFSVSTCGFFRCH